MDAFSVHIRGGETDVWPQIISEGQALSKCHIVQECLRSLLTRSLTKMTPPSPHILPIFPVHRVNSVWMVVFSGVTVSFAAVWPLCDWRCISQSRILLSCRRCWGQIRADMWVVQSPPKGWNMMGPQVKTSAWRKRQILNSLTRISQMFFPFQSSPSYRVFPWWCRPGLLLFRTMHTQ